MQRLFRVRWIGKTAAAAAILAVIVGVLAQPSLQVLAAINLNTAHTRSLALQGSAPEPGIAGVAIHHDVSPALRDLPVTRGQPPAVTGEMTESAAGKTSLPLQPPSQAPGLGSNPLALNSSPDSVSTAGVSFDGISSPGGLNPPDATADVGPNNIVETVNTYFAIYSKTGVVQFLPHQINIIFTGFNIPCETRNDGSSQVLYDKIADRWLISQVVAVSPFGECVAVSTSPDPTGSYYRYFFQFSTTVLYSNPRLSLWPDGYYLTANRSTDGSPQGASAIVLNRAAMLTGATAAFDEFQISAIYLLPASLDGSVLPPQGRPDIIASLAYPQNALSLWRFHVDWDHLNNSTLTGPITLQLSNFNWLCVNPYTLSCVPQPGTAVKVDGLGDRLMPRLVYRDISGTETLTVSHSVNLVTSGIQAGVRWYEIRNPYTTPSVYQFGTYAPDATNRWLSAIAFDRVGNLALGYSVSNSTTVYPGLRYTGRLATDTPGIMTQGDKVLIAGSGSQTGGANRWGDYANMAIDPSDDCTFWFTSEYYATTGTDTWKTRISSFSFISCTAFGTTTTLSADPNPSIYGQQVTFTAHVTLTHGTPVGWVIFSIDGSPVGSQVTLDGSGKATLSTSSLAAGTHTVSASFDSNISFGPSKGSLAGGQVVNQVASSIGMVSSLNPSLAGQAVTFSATVSAGPGLPTPTGTVTFSIGGVAQPPVSLDANGKAALTTSSLPPGSTQVSSLYSGSTNYSASGPTDLEQQVLYSIFLPSMCR